MKLNNSLVYLLIFTVISSLLAYKIVVKAFDGSFDYEAQIVKSK